MKPKKTARANLENKRGIFFQIGFLISLGLVILAFEWESAPRPEKFAGVSLDEYKFEDEVIVTREEKELPKPAPRPMDVLNVINDLDPIGDEILEVDVEIEPAGSVEIYQLPSEPDEEETFFPFQVEEPRFNGGNADAFRVWVMQNLVYPRIAVDNMISGTVQVRFTVSKVGKVKDIVVIREIDPALAREVVRVVSSSPIWVPGKYGTRNVNVVYTMPISFVLR